MSERITLGEADVLLVVDVQNDFCPGGALEVPEGDKVVAVINRLGRLFGHAVFTQDWHPPGHLSFASSHPGKKPFETIDLAYGTQTLWPDHCIEGTDGAAFHPGLETRRAEAFVRKGFRREIDSYSAFYENDHRTATGLSAYLRQRGFRRVFACGLALDFCVGWSAVDAAREGFETYVIEDATRAIDTEGSLAAAKANMAKAGATLIASQRIAV